jgi:AraC family transcriptional regulator of adaptative response/methylated-DNA-[protein]-cysteine methyltransferase
MSSTTAGFPGILLRTVETPLGPMFGAATPRGICLLEFADRGSRQAVVSRMEKDHRCRVMALDRRQADPPSEAPQAQYVEELERQLAAYFGRALQTFHLPLDTAGTPWQQRVWSALREIPYGSTCSYGDIAVRLGNPGGSRAVGRANGQNPVAIVVPCHRVIQADGGLRGYGGGLNRKRWLLDLEAGIQELAF